MNKMKQKRGFTMIELLAVLVILGIILIIAVPSVVGYMQGARTSYYEKLEESVTTIGQEYFSDHRSLMPRENGQIYSVDIKDLVSEGYTSEIVDSDGNNTCTGKVYIKRLATADFEYHACIQCGKVDSEGNQEYTSTSGFCTGGAQGGTGGEDGTCDKPKEDPTDDCFMIEIPDPIKVPQCTTVEDSASSQGISLEGIVLNNGEDIGDRITADTTSVDYKTIGNYKVYYTYKQVLNPSGEKYNFDVTVYDDKSPSKTTVEMHLGSSTGTVYNCSEESCSWTGQDVYITFTATDLSDCGTEGSGVKQFAYRYGESGNWQYVEATKTTQNGKTVYQATIIRNKTHGGIVDVKAIDNAMITGSSKNNEGEITRFYLKVDKTPPSCTSSGGNTNWINASSNPGTVTITGTCNDAHSGCTGNVSKTYSTDINSTTETPGTVYDNVGNSTVCPANRTIKIDKTSPTLSIVASSQNEKYHTTTANVKISGNDNLSGLSQMCILLNDSNVNHCSWQSYTSANQSRGTGHGYDGATVTYYGFVKDESGNISSAVSTSYKVYANCSSTYTNWGNWGGCSTNCGNGTKTRSGTKIDSYLGSNCGTTSDSTSCSDSSGCPPSGGDESGDCCWVDWNNPYGSKGSCVRDVCTTWADGRTGQCGTDCPGRSHGGWSNSSCVFYNCV